MNFDDDFRWSAELASGPFWPEIYRKIFPDLLRMVTYPYGSLEQRMGIDRELVLKTGLRITIEEKVRRKDYGDVLIEFVANTRKNQPGWIERDLACDYLAYAIASTGRCHMFPFQLLRRAWMMNRNAWLRKYGVLRAFNLEYDSLNTAVPLEVVLEAIELARVH